MWVAQCLEHDIGAQGETCEEVLAHLEVALNFAKSRAEIGPAPKHFFELWDKTNRTRNTSAMKDVQYALCA